MDAPDIVAALHGYRDLPITQVFALPPAAYGDAFFAHERAAFLRTQWWCVGHVSSVVQRGSFFCIDLLDEQLVVVRGNDDVIRVHSVACRHRAAPVATGHGTCEQFTCPYHGWTYALEGRLLGAPHMRGSEVFQRADSGLRSFASVVWLGLIFVNLSSNPAPLAPSLQDIEARHRDLALDTMVTTTTFRATWAANWKLVVEQIIENYHHIQTHPQLERIVPSNGATCLENHPSWCLTRMKSTNHLLTPDLHQYHIFPSTLIHASERHFKWYSTLPLDGASSILIGSGLNSPAEAAAKRARGLDDQKYLDHLLGQDRAVVEAQHHTVRSHAAARGALAPVEEPLLHFYRYLARQLG